MANTAAKLRKLSGWLTAHDVDMKMPKGMIDPEVAADEIDRMHAALDQIVTVCRDNAPPGCNAHMALNFVQQVAAHAKAG